MATARLLAALGVGTAFGPAPAAGVIDTTQRQRVLLAQAFVQQAPVVLLDEPTTGLDADATDRVTQQLRRLAASGRTIVSATHDFDVGRRVDHCVLLSGGRVVSSGAPRPTCSPTNVASAVIPTLGR
jgi:zinc/manganese transport system ATP-binding protein